MLNRINIKRFFVALVLCFLLVPIARYISPKAVIDGQALYLAYLPLSVMVAMLLLFGRHAIAPLIIVLAISYSHRYHINVLQLSAFLFAYLALFFWAERFARLSGPPLAL